MSQINLDEFKPAHFKILDTCSNWGEHRQQSKPWQEQILWDVLPRYDRNQICHV